MLRGVVWVFPLIAALVAFWFAGSLGAQFLRRRRLYQLIWMLALAMFAIASLGVVGGVATGWSRSTFEVYWALGAVLNVPFLAAGEVLLLFRRPPVVWGVALVLVFVTAYTVTVLGAAQVDAAAFGEQLPAGRDVFGAGTPAQRLPQLISIPSYVVLLAGALWSAWRMRGRPELKDRFVGTLLVAGGATVVAAGASFSAAGALVGFSATLLVGVVLMFWGFVRASRAPSPAGLAAPQLASS